MTKKKEQRILALPIYKLLPSIITLVALCAGLTAIKFSLEGKLENSVLLLVIAAFLDGMDGRVARYLRVTSDFGAELDSFADFCNFGIAPAFIMYIWAANNPTVKKMGWGIVLFFAICCAVRLARFNMMKKTGSEEEKEEADTFFTGVPAPIGGVIAVLPVIISFEFKEYLSFLKTPWILGVYMIVIALAMASRVPTFAIKKLSVSQENVAFFLAFIGFIIAMLLMKPWITITALCGLYVFSVPVSCLMYYKLRRQ